MKLGGHVFSTTIYIYGITLNISEIGSDPSKPDILIPNIENFIPFVFVGWTVEETPRMSAVTRNACA